MDIGQFELALRVLTILFVIVAPALLFSGSRRGSTYLRDDELIERARQMEGRSSPSPGPPSVSALVASPFETSDDAAVVCEACGTSNRAGVQFCRECFARLPEE